MSEKSSTESASNHPVRMSSKVRVAAFVASVGQGHTFTKLQLFEAVPKVAQADRRMRDLRELGWVIDNYKVNPQLAPDEYLVRTIGTRIDLGDKPTQATRRTVTGAKRRRILDRDGHACQVCGTAAGAEFFDAPGRVAMLSIGHIVPVARGGTDADDNLRAECQRCNDESRDVTTDPPTEGEVLSRCVNVRGGIREKKLLYGWMQAGRRIPTDTEKVFNDWARLPMAQRMRVMSALAGQVIQDMDSDAS